LSKHGSAARLEKAGAHFYFTGGEADNWLDRTVQVPKVSSLTLDEWIEEFVKLKKRNAEIFRAAKSKTAAKAKK